MNSQISAGFEPGTVNLIFFVVEHANLITISVLQDQTFCRLCDVQRGGVPGEEQGHAGGRPLPVHVPLPAPPTQASLPGRSVV